MLDSVLQDTGQLLSSEKGLLGFMALVAVALLIYFISRRLLLRLFSSLVKRTRIKFDDFLFEHRVFERIFPLIPVLIISAGRALWPNRAEAIQLIANILIVIILSRTLTAFMRSLSDYYATLPAAKTHPIKGYVQVVNLVIYILAVLVAIGLLTGRSPWELIAGLGALTAVLLLIFRNTILGLVASVQIAGNDMIHVGDWVEMPKFGADGDVIDIALHTVQVQNWDKTISYIPTYKLIEESFKNWRGMADSGARRIKRSLVIDMNSIAFVTPEQLERFRDIHLLQDYIREKEREIEAWNAREREAGRHPLNQRRMTNVGTFRIYAERYVSTRADIRSDLTCMVRQLTPTTDGLPLEIYAFTNTVEWVPYEHIQADIFDHLLSIAGAFDLRIFQHPSGEDFRLLYKA